MKYKMLVLILLLTVMSWAPKRNPERFVHPAAKHGSRRPGEVCVLRQDCPPETRKLELPAARSPTWRPRTAKRCDRGTEFHEFRCSEFFPQAGEPGFRNINGRPSHAVGVLKNKPFEVREVEVRTVVVQICDLLSGDVVCPACGRADVHSKRTSCARGNAEFGQSLQLVVDQLAAHL